mmetsp:Transcript_56991/g.114373  ORF Transcript_56991/g.114373 Transcript_56991/m.114373 type:complete len:225 (-) Transcript_56991:152-826(-)
MLVTGGLGGLGLIASFQLAAEFENPIITTSRSGRLGSGGPSALNIFESMKELVPVYNVKLDVGSSNAVADVFSWLNKPGTPPEDRSMMLDDIIYQLKYKQHRLPDEALRLLLEFMLETKDRLSEIIYDLKTRETKVDPQTITELQEKDAQVNDCIGRLRAKVGHVDRSGRFTLMGGVPAGSYSVPGMGDMIANESQAAQEGAAPESQTVLEVMQQEMLPRSSSQ